MLLLFEFVLELVIEEIYDESYQVLVCTSFESQFLLLLLTQSKCPEQNYLKLLKALVHLAQLTQLNMNDSTSAKLSLSHIMEGISSKT